MRHNESQPRSGFSWIMNVFFFSSRRRHTRYWRDWSSDVCSSDLELLGETRLRAIPDRGADQSEHRYLPATHAVESNGLAGDPREPACDPDRELASLCIAALFAGDAGTLAGRSEERRVGKECRSRW